MITSASPAARRFNSSTSARQVARSASPRSSTDPAASMACTTAQLVRLLPLVTTGRGCRRRARPPSATMELKADGARAIERAVASTKDLLASANDNSRFEIAFFDHAVHPLVEAAASRHFHESAFAAKAGETPPPGGGVPPGG